MKVPYQLRLLWAEVPRVHCKGLCWDSCGPISASAVERAVLADEGLDVPRVGGEGRLERLDRILGVNEKGEPVVLACPALTEDHRCAVYPVRPLICRMWGAISELPCEHGCRVEGGRLLTNAESGRILRMAEALPVPVEIRRPEDRARPARTGLDTRSAERVKLWEPS